MNESSNKDKRLYGKTILVNIDIFPKELVNLINTYQEQGLILPPEKDERYGKLIN